jgi:hypothetical protein
MSSVEYSPRERGLLALAGTIDDGNAAASALFRTEPPTAYTADECRLSVLVQRALDHMIAGGCYQLVLLKLYPRTGRQLAPTSPEEHRMLSGDAPPEEQALQAAWSDLRVGAVRHETAVHMAVEAISFFGPLHGGIVTQTAYSDVIVQGRQFTGCGAGSPRLLSADCYPHFATIGVKRSGCWKRRSCSALPIGQSRAMGRADLWASTVGRAAARPPRRQGRR